MRFWILSAAISLLFIPSWTYAAGDDVSVALLDETGAVITDFHPFGEDYRGAGSVTAGDLDQDQIEEIIIGSGPGLAPEVIVYNQSGEEIRRFLAYGENFKGGLTVATCDLNGNGQNEIVTGTMLGGGPHVRIFDATGNVLYRGGFFAYDEAFRGGVNVACGDVDYDGFDDIVTGAGLTGGPHVKVFTPGGIMKTEIFSGSASENTGATVAIGDLDGNGDDEIIAGRMGAGEPTIMAFNYKKGHLSFMVALNGFEEYSNGIHVVSGDIDGDGRDEIGATTNRHEQGLIRFFELTGAEVKSITPFTEEGQKGVVATVVRQNNQDQVLAMSSSPRNHDQIGKYIRVDISDQKLYAYENGVLVNDFYVSTGTWAYPTPLGITDVSAKLLYHDYVWNYGEGNPNNYALYGVKYNLRFRRHHYIHSAYWHNNFGRRMSHGCVNVSTTNAEWVFNWADVGTTVEVAN